MRLLTAHPFLASLLVLLLVVIPGFVRVEQLHNRIENQQSCIVDAFEDRDATSAHSRYALLAWLQTTRQWLKHPQSDTAGLIAAIDTYIGAINDSGDTAAATSLPDCLD